MHDLSRRSLPQNDFCVALRKWWRTLVLVRGGEIIVEFQASDDDIGSRTGGIFMATIFLGFILY